MASPLQIGQTVRIKNVRSGRGEVFGAQVTGEDKGRYYVTMTNSAGNNRAAPTHQPIPQVLRFEDGTPCEDGEQYRIIEIIGAPTDLGQAMADSIKAVEELKAENAKLRNEIITRNSMMDKKLGAIVDTIASFVEDDLATAIRQALSTGVPVQAPVIEEVVPPTVKTTDPKPVAKARA